MSPGWKGRDWGGWDTPGGCGGAPGGEHRELLSELLCKPSVPALPGRGSCSLGCFWDGSGLCPGCSISGGPFRAAPGRGAAGSPRSVSIPALPGHPSARPGLCLAAACHGQGTEAQLLPAGTKDKRGWFPPWGSASSRPAFPASWATGREHQEHSWQGAGVPEGSVQLRAREAAPGSAPTVILGCERSPAGNAPLQVGPALTLSRTLALDQGSPQDLSCSFLPGKGRGISTFTAIKQMLERAGNQGCWKDFVLSHNCSPVLFCGQVLAMDLCLMDIPGPGV